MSRFTAVRPRFVGKLSPIATLVAISAFVCNSHAQETPSEELNRQLDQAADQSVGQQDTLNDQLDQAEGQADQQEAEVNDLIEESEGQVHIQENEFEQQLDQVEDATGAEVRSLESPAFPSQDDRRLRWGLSVDAAAELSDGITVGEIMTGGAAATAGLRRGDVIVSIDGRTLTTADELDRFIHDYSAGDSVDVIVLRDGRRYPLTVTFEDAHYSAPADYDPPIDYAAPDAIDYEHRHPHVGPHGWLGVMLQPSNPPHRMQGVGIVSVVHEGPADSAGVEPGDRVLSMNHETLTSAEHLLHLLSHTDPGDQIELHVLNDGFERPVTLRLADANVSYVDPPMIYWYYSGNPASGYWYLAASVEPQPPGPTHAEILEEHQSLVEQQQRMESMLREIQSDLASIQRELDVRPTSGTIDPGEFGDDSYR